MKGRHRNGTPEGILVLLLSSKCSILKYRFFFLFVDRDHRLKEMKEHLEELQANSKLLQEEQQKLRLHYEKVQ